MLGRLPTELNKVGEEHRAVHITSGNRAVQWLLNLLGCDILIEDISEQITAKEYEELEIELHFERQEREEAQRQADMNARHRR